MLGEGGMRIEKDYTIGFCIVKGQGRKETYFCFFVDSDKAAWSKKPWQRKVYKREEDAQEALDELRRRAKLRRMKTA